MLLRIPTRSSRAVALLRTRGSSLRLHSSLDNEPKIQSPQDQKLYQDISKKVNDQITADVQSVTKSVSSFTSSISSLESIKTYQELNQYYLENYHQKLRENSILIDNSNTFIINQKRITDKTEVKSFFNSYFYYLDYNFWYNPLILSLYSDIELLNLHNLFMKYSRGCYYNKDFDHEKDLFFDPSVVYNSFEGTNRNLNSLTLKSSLTLTQESVKEAYSEFDKHIKHFDKQIQCKSDFLLNLKDIENLRNQLPSKESLKKMNFFFKLMQFKAKYDKKLSLVSLVDELKKSLLNKDNKFISTLISNNETNLDSIHSEILIYSPYYNLNDSLGKNSSLNTNYLDLNFLTIKYGLSKDLTEQFNSFAYKKLYNSSEDRLKENFYYNFLEYNYDYKFEFSPFNHFKTLENSSSNLIFENKKDINFFTSILAHILKDQNEVYFAPTAKDAVRSIVKENELVIETIQNNKYINNNNNDINFLIKDSLQYLYNNFTPSSFLLYYMSLYYNFYVLPTHFLRYKVADIKIQPLGIKYQVLDEERIAKDKSSKNYSEKFDLFLPNSNPKDLKRPSYLNIFYVLNRNFFKYFKDSSSPQSKQESETAESDTLIKTSDPINSFSSTYLSNYYNKNGLKLNDLSATFPYYSSTISASYMVHINYDVEFPTFEEYYSSFKYINYMNNKKSISQNLYVKLFKSFVDNMTKRLNYSFTYAYYDKLYKKNKRKRVSNLATLHTCTSGEVDYEWKLDYYNNNLNNVEDVEDN